MSERSLSPEEAEIVQLREQVGASRERERHLREVLNDAYNHLEELRHELALSNEPGLAADIRDTLERIHNVRTGPARIDTSETPATSSEASNSREATAREALRLHGEINDPGNWGLHGQGDLGDLAGYVPKLATGVLELLEEREHQAKRFAVVEAERDMHYHFRACGQCRDYPNRPHCAEGDELRLKYRKLAMGEALAPKGEGEG